MGKKRLRERPKNLLQRLGGMLDVCLQNANDGCLFLVLVPVLLAMALWESAHFRVGFLQLLCAVAGFAWLARNPRGSAQWIRDREPLRITLVVFLGCLTGTGIARCFGLPLWSRPEFQYGFIMAGCGLGGLAWLVCNPRNSAACIRNRKALLIFLVLMLVCSFLLGLVGCIEGVWRLYTGSTAIWRPLPF